MPESKNKYSLRLHDNARFDYISVHADTSPEALENIRNKRYAMKKHYTRINTEFAARHGIHPIHSSGYSHYMIAELTEREAIAVRKDACVQSVTLYEDVPIVNHQSDIISRQIKSDNITGSHSVSFPPYLGNGVGIGVVSAQNLTFIPQALQLTGLEEQGRIVYLEGASATEEAVHSTVVTSIIVGKSVSFDVVEYRGVAPLSTVYFAPSFDKIGMYEAIEKCVDNGASIINYSAGEAFPDGEYSDFDFQIDTLIYNVGFCFVTSAGNASFVSSPATACNGITVGNAQTKDSRETAEMPPYQMFCKAQDDCSAYIQAEYLPNKPDISAPGTYVHYINSVGKIEFNLYGTSFAAPYVTGVAAQIVEKYPRAAFSPLIIKAVLLCGANPRAIDSRDDPPVAEFDRLRVKSGAGLLDSVSSLESTEFKSGTLSLGKSENTSIMLRKGQTVRAVLCYFKSPQDISSGFTGNITLELHTPGGTRAAFSDSIRENVKVIEYTSGVSGEHILKAVNSQNRDARDETYALAWRILPA